MPFAKKKSVLISSVVSSILLVSIGIIFNDIPVRDVAHRYPPVSESFACGNRQCAFILADKAVLLREIDFGSYSKKTWSIEQ